MLGFRKWYMSGVGVGAEIFSPQAVSRFAQRRAVRIAISWIAKHEQP